MTSRRVRFVTVLVSSLLLMSLEPQVSVAQSSNAVPATYGTMYGNPIPTPLLIPPGLHARFLAEPVETTQLDGATFAYGAFWTVTTGYPATLEAVDPATGAVTVDVPLEGAYGAWAVAAGPDNTIWAGTYHKGIVYSYSLATHTVRTVVRIPGANTVWGLAWDPQDARMWAGTWPNGIWTINPVSGAAAEVGLLPGEAGPHAVAYANGQVFAGAYPTMDVVDVSAPGMPSVRAGTMAVQDLLGGAGQVRAIGWYDGHLVVLGANGQLVWLGSVGSVGSVAYQTLSDCQTLPVMWNGRAVVIRDASLVAVTPGVPGRWNADNLPIAAVVAALPANKYWSAYGVAGGDFYALASDGTLVRVTPDGQVSQSVPALTASPGIIQSMAATPNGLLGGGYLGGNVWQYDRGQWTRFHGMDQVDSITACGNDVYLGVYPNARLYVYHPTQAWNPPQNPKLVGSPGHPQDRVPAIACVNGTAFIGTVPQNTSLGGTIYTSQGKTYAVPVPTETPVSLAAFGNELAGSLSNEEALGSPRPPVDAHLFVLNLATGQAQVADLGHRQTFAGVLTVGPYVYAASREYLARWDPQTGTLTVKAYSRDTTPSLNWGFTTHLFTVDGRLYLISPDGWVYLVNPSTLAATPLFYGAQHAAVMGANVYFTFYDSRWVISLPIADLTPQNAAWPWNFWYIWRHDGHIWPKPA